MMTLKRFRVTNFRSIIDSGWIDCDDVTSLVGINEAGKSNVILALWKLRPVRDGEIDLLHDMPTKEYSSWRSIPEKIVFISADFELDSTLIDKVVKKKYPTGLTQSATSEIYPHLQHTKDAIANAFSVLNPVNPTNNDEARNLMIAEMPSFVYYSNYGNLDAQIYLPHAIKWLNNEEVAGIDNSAKVRTLRVLFDFVKLNPQEVLDLGKDPVRIVIDNYGRETTKQPTKEEIEKATEQKAARAILLNSASTDLTRKFREWWKQGNYIFRFQADGEFFKIWVSDDKRPEEIELERRSTGLQWFLSFFLIFLVESQEAHKGAILLLDEAGQSLHPLAQKDLIAFFDNLAKTNQLIYTTHSPFLVDTSNIDRAKVVYSDNDGLTVVSSDLRAADDRLNEKSIYAVHAALGLSVSDILLQGCQPIIVEGPSDQHYFNAIKIYLIRNKKYAPNMELVFIPSGGVRGVAGVVSIVSGKDGELPLVVLDADGSGKSAREKLQSGLYKHNENSIIDVGELIDFKDAEVEDLVPPSLISRQIGRLFRDVEDEYFEDVLVTGQALVPQVESFAEKHNVALPKGWKVDVARGVKQQLQKANAGVVPDEYLKKWITLFDKFNR